MSECIICISVKKKVLICNKCQTNTCKKCLIKYKKFECCNCKNLFSENYLKKFFFTEDIIKNYMFYYVYKNYFFNDKIKDIINNYFLKQENQKQLRFGYIKEDVRNLSSVIKKCFNENCNGVFYSSSCSVCSLKLCIKCEEKEHKGTKCDETILKNLEDIKQNCKQCPFCYVYILKTEGCNSMKCTYCGASFNWRNLKIDNKKFNNEHYNNILNKDLNKKFLEHFVNNKFVLNKKTDNIFNFTFLKKNKFLNELEKNNFLNLKKQLKENIKKIKKYQISYLLEIEKILKNNVEESLDNLFDQIDFIICKKIYIEDKKKKFILELFNFVENIFLEKKNFNIDNIKIYISDYEKNNILLESFTYYFINNNIELISNVKKTIKEFTLYEKANYINNGKIKLLDEEQLNHTKEVYIKLFNYNFCLNSSYAGSGKTYTSLYAAKKLEIKYLFILTPKIMFEKWNNILEYYNYKNKFNYLILTYSELYGKNFSINNNLFEKKYLSQNKIDIILSDYLLQFINKNTMFIIDEIHNSKKKSTDTSKFIEKLSSTIRKKNGYVLGLSATPLEKISEIKFLLDKLNCEKKYKPICFSNDKICLNYKHHIPSIYDILYKKNVKENLNKFFDQNSSESEDSEENFDDIYNDNEEINNLENNELPGTSNTENNLENNTQYNDLPGTSKEALKKINLNIPKNIVKQNKKSISEEKIKILMKVMKEITLNSEKNFFLIYKIKPDIKKEKNLQKIINLLKNLFKKFQLTPEKVLEKLREEKKSFRIDNLKISKEKILLIEKSLSLNPNYLKEINDLNDLTFKHNILLYLKENNKKDINIDIHSVKYVEEIGYNIYNIFKFSLSSIFKNINPVDIKLLYSLYLYKFKLHEIFYLVINIEYLYDILLKVFFKEINFGLKINIENNLDCFENLYCLNFNLEDQDKEILEYAFTSIDIKTKQHININSLNFISIVNKGLEQTETVYIKYLYNIINLLNTLNKFKIVLGVSYTNTINDLSNLFKKEKINFSMINGSVKNKFEIINNFQENDNLNILLVNIQSLNCGLDLDDKIGNKPRIIFVVPNFNFTNLVQFMFRFKRKNSLSEPYIYLINNHKNILDSLLKKYKDIAKFKFNIPCFVKIPIKSDSDILEELIT